MFQRLGSDDVREEWQGQDSRGAPVVLRLMETRAPGLHSWRVAWYMARSGGESFDNEQDARAYLAEQVATQPGLRRVSG